MEPKSETPISPISPTDTPTVTRSNHSHRVIILGVGGVIVGLCVGIFVSALMNKDREPEWKKTLPETNILDEAVENYEPDTTSEWVEAPPTPTSTSTMTNVSTLYIDQTDYSMYYKNLVQQDRVTWLPRPEPIENQKIIFLDPEVYGSGYAVTYLKLGTVGDADIIISIIPCSGMCFSDDVIMF